MTSNRKRAFFIACAALLSVVAFSSRAFAQLPPGGTVYNPAVNPPFTPNYSLSGVPGGPTGYSLLTSQNFAYNYLPGDASHAYFGQVISKVYIKNDGSGRLAFSYQFDNEVPPTAPDNTHDFDINHITVGGTANAWNGVTILAEGADSSGLSTPVTGGPFAAWNNGNPFDIVRANNPGDQGIGLFESQFSSGTLLLRGTAATPNPNITSLVWFATDATAYTVTGVGLQDSQSTVGTSSAYAPIVPEPSTIALSIVAGLAVCGAVVRRRANAG